MGSPRVILGTSHLEKEREEFSFPRADIFFLVMAAMAIKETERTYKPHGDVIRVLWLTTLLQFV